MDRDLRPVMHRYLGAEIGDGYLKATRGDSADGVALRRYGPFAENCFSSFLLAFVNTVSKQSESTPTSTMS